MIILFYLVSFLSPFYVYKFYFIYFPQVQHRTAIPRVGVASSTILKNIEGFGGEQLPLAQNHFYTQNRVQKWSFLKTCFKQYDYQNGTYILTHRPYIVLISFEENLQRVQAQILACHSV